MELKTRTYPTFGYSANLSVRPKEREKEKETEKKEKEKGKPKSQGKRSFSSGNHMAKLSAAIAMDEEQKRRSIVHVPKMNFFSKPSDTPAPLLRSSQPTSVSLKMNQTPQISISQLKGLHAVPLPKFVSNVDPIEPKKKVDIPKTIQSNSYKKFFTPAHQTCWTEKYRPQSITQIFGNEQSVGMLKHWIENRINQSKRIRKRLAQERKKEKYESEKVTNLELVSNIGDSDPEMSGSIAQIAALLHGPPGIGKTSVAQAILQDAGYEVIMINASCDSRTPRQVLDDICKVANVDTFCIHHQPEYKKPKKKAIVVDEIDGMYFGENLKPGTPTFTMQDFVNEFLSFSITTSTPIIFVCNSIHKIGGDSKPTTDNGEPNYSLKSICCTIPFFPPFEKHVLACLKNIAQKEEIVITIESLKQLYVKSGGDLRQAILLLQYYHQTREYKKKRKTREPIESNPNSNPTKKSKKDIAPNLFQVTERVLYGTKDSITTIMDSDIVFDDFHRFSYMVESNCMQGGYQVYDIETISSVLDHVGDADLLTSYFGDGRYVNHVSDASTLVSLAPIAATSIQKKLSKYNFDSVESFTKKPAEISVKYPKIPDRSTWEYQSQLNIMATFLGVSDVEVVHVLHLHFPFFKVSQPTFQDFCTIFSKTFGSSHNSLNENWAIETRQGPNVYSHQARYFASCAFDVLNGAI